MATQRFPEIHLTSSERAFYNGLASAALRKAVAEYTKCSGFVDTNKWGYVRRRKGVSMYRSLEPRIEPRTTVMIGTGQIPGTLKEVMDGLYCDTTADLRCVKTLLGYKLLDGAVLNVSERREPSAPFRFAGIKWFAGKAAWGMTSDRDVLAYERMGTIVDKHGVEVAYHVIQSVDRPEWPANTIRGMRRQDTSSCYLYRRDKTGGVVQCFLRGEVYDISPITQRVAEFAIAGVWLSVVCSVQCAQAKKCSELIDKCSSTSVSKSATCHVCYKGQGFMKMKTLVKCAGCSQNACKSCSFQHAIFKIDTRTGSPEVSRFCKLCMNRVHVSSSPESSSSASRERLVSEPESLSFGTPVSFPTPQLRKMSHKIKYELLDTSFPVQSQSVSTQSSSFDDQSSSLDDQPSSLDTHALSIDERVLSVLNRSQSDATSAQLLAAQYHYHLSMWSANSYSSESVSSSSIEELDMPLVDDPLLRRTAGLGEFDLDLDALPLLDDDENHELDADLRPTEGLDAFDLDMNIAALEAANSSRGDKLRRTHHELVFSSSKRRVGREKERFLTDLYASRPPTQRRQHA